MRDIGSVRPLPPLVADQDQAAAGTRAGAGPRAGAAPGTRAPIPGQDELHARRERRTGSAHRGGALARRRRRGGRGRRRRRRVAPVGHRHPADVGVGLRSRSCGPATPAATPTGRPRSCARPAWARPWSVGTLPPPPAGKVYELWLQQPDGTMARAGLISDVAGSGTAWSCRATPRRPPAPASRSSRPAARTHPPPPRWRSSRSPEPERRPTGAVSASGAGPPRRPAPASRPLPA